MKEQFIIIYVKGWIILAINFDKIFSHIAINIDVEHNSR